jgi:hypothetical protein
MLNFEEVKRVRIIEVAARYGIRFRYRGNWANGQCPLPTHKEGDKGRNFSVNVAQNYWRCFSASCNENNEGRRGGDVINFVALMENCRESQAAQKLAEWYGLNGNKTAPHTARPIEESKGQTPLKDSPDNNRPSDSGKGYMKGIDVWFDKLFGLTAEQTQTDYWTLCRNGIKAKLIESYKNGKAAGT